MTKRFCDRCGKEVGVFKDIEFQTWWTITRHGMLDLTTELCDACYQAKFDADTPQTEQSEEPCEKCKHFMTKDMGEIWCIGKRTCERFEPRELTDCQWK